MVGELAQVNESTGRAEAFRRLAARHLEESYRLARAIVGPADAEDVTHDAFVTAWQKWSSLRDPALFEHWFHRILVNTCRNRLRHVQRLAVRDISAGMSVAVTDAIGQTLERDELSAAMTHLTPDERIVVALRFYRDLTVEQIANQLGIRQGTVKSRLHYALRRLEGFLDEAEPQGASE
jgi:RNA polymerase sigma-70 factor, ECF subfamily